MVFMPDLSEKEKDVDAALQMWQDHFCALTNVYALCMDGSGRERTTLSGPEEDLEKLKEVITQERIRAIYLRVSESPLEDQAVEYTDAPNIRLAATAIKNQDAGTDSVFIVIGAISMADRDTREYRLPALEGLSRRLSEAGFMNTIDFLRDTMNTIYALTAGRDEALELTRQAKALEQKMSEQFHRAEAMTQIVSWLDSDQSIEQILEAEIRCIGEYLDVSNAFLVRVHKMDDFVDVMMQWAAEGEKDIFVRTENLERYWFLEGETVQVISAESSVSPGEREVLEVLGVNAIAVLPVLMNARPAFYICFTESREPLEWTVDDVKFLTDAGRILQSIVTKRNQKNSLAGSYAALESMLDNIGSSIYVRDIKTNGMLFANRSLRNHFSKELRDGTLQTLFEDNVPTKSHSGNFEIYHEDKNRWYDLYYTHIKWVDFRPVSLCAIYDITEKKLYQKRIEQQAYTDFLTGLYNRMCFERDLQKHIDDAKRSGRRGAMMYLDLDDFKHINDGLGHQYGDTLLKSISKAISSIEGLKGSCYRMGGDEFVIIVTASNYDRFDHIMEDIRTIFSRSWTLKEAEYYCTMSMGIVEFPTEGETVNELTQKADIAMYEAKRGGKNRIARYSDQMDSVSERRLDMEKNMRDAVVEQYDEFEIYYQPIVSVMEPGTPCTGAEALVRWNSKMGFITPGEFIPLAEYLGLIAPSGNHVLERACEACAEWNRNGHPEFHINVNLSVVQLLQHDIVETVKKALEKSRLVPGNLTLEVTESLAIDDLDRMKLILMNIKRLGVKLALDDFGTGYSSLGNLRVLPFDIIKVDQNFARDLAEDTYSQSFVRMIGELADAIDADVCVEGIETAEQLKVLADMHVEYVQGYFFDKPLKRDEFESAYISPAPKQRKRRRRAAENATAQTGESAPDHTEEKAAGQPADPEAAKGRTGKDRRNRKHG